ncbi:MAG: sigma-70 family RNA polymerase sigma factor [Myxococcales bacterium]|nr:sigma-70 family RNA polymerase sigma factor [Myxococcales bacterium]
MSDWEERKLVKRLKARDTRAFREFVEAHEGRVFGLVFRILGDREEAEDVSQEVFVTVFKAIDSFRQDSKLSTWLYRIAVNHAKNRLKYLSRRGQNRKQPIQDTRETDLEPSHARRAQQPEQIAIGRQLEQQVSVALSRLEEQYRVIIVLRDVNHLSYEEIGEITGLNLGTVKSRLHRARAALRQWLEANRDWNKD